MLIAFFIITIATAIYLVKIDETRIVSGLFAGALTGFVLSALLVFTPISIYTSLIKEPVIARQPVLALSDGSSVSGSFFLGSGTVNERPAFYYYVEHEDGSATLEYEYAQYVKVFQTEEDEPYVESECDSLADVPEWLITPIDNWMGDYNCGTNKTFYIPAGSIQQNYLLDAE